MTLDNELAMSAIADEISLHELECNCALCVRYYFIMEEEKD